MSGERAVLGAREIKRRLKTFPAWCYDGRALVRLEKFPTYAEALKFVGRLGRAAEKEDHHPDVVMNYKTVTVKWRTHFENGVTPRDFKMASVTDEVVRALARR